MYNLNFNYEHNKKSKYKQIKLLHTITHDIKRQSSMHGSYWPVCIKGSGIISWSQCSIYNIKIKYIVHTFMNLFIYRSSSTIYSLASNKGIGKHSMHTTSSHLMCFMTHMLRTEFHDIKLSISIQSSPVNWFNLFKYLCLVHVVFRYLSKCQALLGNICSDKTKL